MTKSRDAYWLLAGAGVAVAVAALGALAVHAAGPPTPTMMVPPGRPTHEGAAGGRQAAPGWTPPRGE